MAKVNRPLPDEFQEPLPHAAPAKSVVETVLHYVQLVGNSALSLFTGLLAGALILYSGYVLYDSVYTQNQAFSSSWEVLQYKPEIIDDGAVPLSGGDELTAINQDYRAWLTIYDTNIDYPVMQGEDDLYYAGHNIYDESSLTGALYLAAANDPALTDGYNMIYGHHMDNGAMFGGLDAFCTESYFNSHRTGVLVSSSKVYDLTIFAVVRTHAYDRTIFTLGTLTDELLDYIDAKAVVEDMAAAEGATQIVGFSTCASADTDGRLIVFAVMTERDLDPTQITDPDFLTLAANGYEGVYDGQAHAAEATANLAGAKIEYSIDGGVTWSTIPPTITNVGTVAVQVRANYGKYGPVTAETVLRVTPAEVTVRANNASKVYGAADPAFSASIEGLLGSDTISFSIVRTNSAEDVGSYPGVIVPRGEANQGNYHVTYIPGDFTITPGTLALSVSGFDGVYDARPHGPSASTSVPGAKIEYSTDGGVTWSTTAPSWTNVGTHKVLVRASAANYDTATAEVTVVVRLRIVTVTANAATKAAGEDDPSFTARVSGVIDGYVLVYTVTRPGAGTDEEPGSYAGAIVPDGPAVQGNYAVEFVPADFTITEALPVEEPPAPTEEPAPTPSSPIEQIVEPLKPEGSRDRAWALVNLLSLLLTVYVFVPLLQLKAKFGRAKTMRQLNEQSGSLLYDVEKYLRRFRVGVGLEALLSVGSIVAFVLTEDMRLPMVLIDKWTPLMLALLVGSLVSDLTLARKAKEEKETVGAAK